jgi:hypothetical protein
MNAHQILVGIAAVCFLLLAAGVGIGSLPLLPIGLFFFALGHLV